MKVTWTKTASTATAILAAACFTGCVVPSLQPLFEETDAISEPALLGKWTKDKESFEFTQIKDKKAYQVVNTDKDGNKATWKAWYGKIGDKQYLNAVLDPETMPETSQLLAIPSHFLIFRVEQTTPELKLTMLNAEACQKLLNEKPTAVAHTLLKPEGEKDKDAIAFLTATSANLRKFIAEYGDKAGLFPAKETMTFTRPAASKPAAEKAPAEK